MGWAWKGDGTAHGNAGQIPLLGPAAFHRLAGFVSMKLLEQIRVLHQGTWAVTPCLACLAHTFCWLQCRLLRAQIYLLGARAFRVEWQCSTLSTTHHPRTGAVAMMLGMLASPSDSRPRTKQGLAGGRWAGPGWGDGGWQFGHKVES